MFGALRQGSAIYVLDKQNRPSLKIGRVESTTQPTGYNMIPYANPVSQTIDVVVKYDDGTTDEYKQMQTQSSVAVYGNVVITETRELMLQEIDTMAREARKVIESVKYHEGVLQSVNEIKVALSPEFAKEVETDKRLITLEKGQKAILDMLQKLNAPNSKN